MKWSRVPLQKVARVAAGFGFPREHQGATDEEYPFLKVGDMNLPGNEVEMRYSLNTVSAETLSRLGAKALPAGTIIFPKIGPAIATEKKRILVQPSAYDNNVMGVVPGDEIESRFLYYWFLTVKLQDLANIGPVPSIRKSTITGLQCPLPPPSEQRRIVEILNQADALRKLRAEADAKAERILPALFIKMFGDPATNPMGWPSVPLKSLLSQKPRNGISPSSGGKVPGRVLTLTAITGAHFDEQAVKDAFFAKPLRSEKFVDEQDFLICRGNGNINLVGRGRFPIRSMPETVFPDTIIAARIDPEKLDRQYLETQWKLPSFRAKIEARARTTSGIHKVNQRVIGNIEILAPPVERQRLFSSNANVFGALRRDRSAAILGNLFSVLLHRAFDGTLTSSWREAHMKELLQEMEQQAKTLEAAR